MQKSGGVITVKFLHVLAMFIFLLVSICGFVFKVNEGVFIGLAFLPMELRIILAYFGKSKPALIRGFIIVCGLLGLAYFEIGKLYMLGALFLLIQALLFFIVSRNKRAVNEEKAE